MRNNLQPLIVGTGNVAFSLASALHVSGLVFQVHGRNNDRLQLFRSEFGVSCTSSIEMLDQVELAIVCVKDDAIEALGAQLAAKAKIVCHTSGAVPLVSSFGNHSSVFYPFQTFSGNRIKSFNEIPIFIESKSTAAKALLFELAKHLNAHPKEMTADVRQVLHIAGVFANNFTTVLIEEAKQLLNSQNISVDTLLPLLKETVSKSVEMNLESALTGPAKRRDMGTINQHMDHLENKPELSELYKVLTHYILNKTEKTDD
ncbi:MAG: DUF2520 domain-containing protein [Flavobacteriales bacterium]|nr:DUF2520 domain-containing protein [Flavobacteriales bacterium]